MKKKLLHLLVMGIFHSFIGIILQTAFLTCVFASSSDAQRVKSVREEIIDVTLEDAGIVEIFSAIESATDYKFVYLKKDLDEKYRLSFSRKKAFVADILLTVSRDNNLSFRQEGKYISVKKLNDRDISASMPLEVIIQKNTITGKVTSGDDSGPLPGVNIMEKGTSNGAVSDVDGNYSITVSEGSVLIFSSVGYLTEEVLVDNRLVIDVVLTPDIQQLGEIVVVGYGVQEKSSVTGAISSVKSKDIENRSITRVEQALQGKTAGVQIIQTSGSPGAAATVRVRGFSSNSASDPLYVVDGLRTNDIGAIDPNNIESIEILKDAASAAIYGAEAGNGVVLITTKSGKSGKGKLTYDLQYVDNRLARIPQVMNAAEYLNYMTEGNLIVEADIPSLWDGETDTDWTDVAFENSVMSRHNLGFQGGNDKGDYYLSLSYLGHDGIIKGDKDNYERFTGMINARYAVKPWLNVGTTMNLEKWKRKAVSENNEYGSLLGAVLTMDPLTPDVYDADALPDFMQNLLDAGNVLLQNDKGQYYGLSQVFESDQVHPAIMRDRTDAETSGGNVMGTIYGDLTPIAGLTITSKLGYRALFFNSYGFDHIYYANAVARNVENITVRRTTSNNVYYQWENWANYDFALGRHNFQVMLGMSYSDGRNTSVNGSGNQLIKDDPLFRDLDYLAATANRSLAGGYADSRKLSYFGRLSYNYRDKYLLQGSLRRDANDESILPKENRWGTFPAFSAGYIISNEDFFPETSLLTHAKFRASWGQNGSIGPLSGYQYLASISSSGAYPFGEAIEYNVGSAPNRLNNPELKWETSEQYDFGFDIRMFNDRMTFTADYYEKKTKDLLVATVPPYETGVATSTVNAGNVSNKGFEFELGWKDMIGEFSYGFNGNIATLNNKVTYLDPSISRIAGANLHVTTVTFFEVGYPVWYMRGYQLEDIDNETGDPIFVDQLTIDSDGDGVMDEADGIINDADKVMIGSGVPDFTYGLTLTAAYKGFDLLVFGAGSHGNDIFMGLSRTDRPRGNRLTTFYDERWTPDNQEASRPRPNSNDQDKYWYSSDMIFSGSFFKVKQLQLGYTLPKSLTQKIAMSNLRFYISLDDWFVFTSYPGMDPEASAGETSALGMDKGAYPNAKKTVFGLNVSF